MKKYKKPSIKDHVKHSRKIKSEEWNEFNEKMEKVMDDSRRKQNASMKSAKNVWLD